jgi:hypothetical protein
MAALCERLQEILSYHGPIFLVMSRPSLALIPCTSEGTTRPVHLWAWELEYQRIVIYIYTAPADLGGVSVSLEIYRKSLG